MPGITTLSRNNFKFTPKTEAEIKAAEEARARRKEEKRMSYRATEEVVLVSPQRKYVGTRKVITFVVPSVLYDNFAQAATENGEEIAAAICCGMEMYIEKHNKEG